MVSWSPGWPQTQSVAERDLESFFHRLLRLQAHISMIGLCSTGIGTQSFMGDRQTFLQLKYTPRPCSPCFINGDISSLKGLAYSPVRVQKLGRTQEPKLKYCDGEVFAPRLVMLMMYVP